MIKIETLVIKEFRGIRDLTLQLGRNSFAVCGPNGTGKSGIVDAVEFALTGGISRLAGTGTSGISVREHAPHVDSRNRPDKAMVTLTAWIPSLKKQATIERLVSAPSDPRITPNDPAVLAVFEQVAAHPEFVLSRRELIRYILSTPGDRSKEIQALLRLDQIETLRASLLRIANSYKREIPSATLARDSAIQQLAQALQIPRATTDELLPVVNRNRQILGLPAIDVLTAITSVKDGLASLTVSGQRPRIPKALAVADLKNVKDAILGLGDAAGKAERDSLVAELTEFMADSAAVQGVTRTSFLKTALTLLDDEACPVCDKPWNLEELRMLIAGKLAKFDAAAKRREAFEKRIATPATLLQSMEHALAAVRQLNLLPPSSPEAGSLSNFEATCRNRKRILDSFIPIQATVDVLSGFSEIPPEVGAALVKLDELIAIIPEPTGQDAARDLLVICQERLEAYRTAQLRLKNVQESWELTDKICLAYNTQSTAVLDGIYKEVEAEFSAFYRYLNSDDESGFKAELLPSAGKLGFNVDFYGRGFFPPGAYHSEGHQDGMGLCLYLALMKHLLGTGFNLAVLDDVLMSVDSGHRRDACALLKERFPDTQFILTTHDDVWLRHMKTAGLVGEGASIRFRTWDVDHGPKDWESADIWNEIQGFLNANDVRSASGLLRNYLEYASKEMCYRLRAPIELRDDAQFQLGDLLPGATSSFSKLLGSGKAAALSWSQTAQAQAIQSMDDAFSLALKKTNADQWQINPALHYNEWANLQASDFSPVVEAFKELLPHFQCNTCNAFVEVVPNRGPKQTLKCTCGAININLEKNSHPAPPANNSDAQPEVPAPQPPHPAN